MLLILISQSLSCLFCATVPCKAIESANVVGYTEVARTAKYMVSGNMFVVPAGQTWKISDLKIVDGDFENDQILFMQPTVSKVDYARAFYYDSDEKYWCYADAASGKQDEELEAGSADDVIPAGTAFLCVFNTSTAKLMYAGEVQKGPEGYIKIPRASKYQLMVNQLPYAIDLTDMKIEDGDFENDQVMFFQGTVSKVDYTKAYYYDSDEKYWCYADAASGKQDEEVQDGDQPLAVGAGFLTVFNTSGAKVVFTAPSL